MKTEVTIGEIRHTTRKLKVIIKVAGPVEAEMFEMNEDVKKVNLYVQTNHFPKYHYVIILKTVENLVFSSQSFYLVRLITNSPDYDNFKVTPDLIADLKFDVNLNESYITRDKFLVPCKEIKTDKHYGKFDVSIIEKMLEI